jgi:hypothetical protein
MKRLEGQKPLPWETTMLCLCRTELYKVTALAILVLAVSCLPYALGYGFAPPGWDFSGFIINAEDSNTYLAAMQQGAHGAWRFRLLYTSEDHPGAFLYLFYLLLGHLSALTGSPLILTYHLARLLCGLALLMVAYFFIAFFIRRRAVRWIAYLLVCFSSGLGWLLLLIRPTPPGGISPIDFWLMDAYVFFALFTLPHFCLATAALLATFLATLTYFRTPRLRYLLIGGLSVLVMAIVHPFAVLIVDAVLAVYWLFLWGIRRRWPGRETVGIAVIGLVPLPLLAYDYCALQSNSVFRAWQAQNFTPSPPPGYYVLGYGLVLLLACPGAIHVLLRRDQRGLFLVVWAVVAAVLAYSPLLLQRRMVEGLHVPLCILATLGLFRYVLPAVHRSRLARWLASKVHYPRRRFRLLVLNLLLAATFPSNSFLLASAGLVAWQHQPPFFYLRAENAAIDWLGAHTRWTDTVLAAFPVGNYIPARIGHRVFWGHWIETVDYEGKKQLAEAFFQAETDDAVRRELLQTWGIAYLFYGPQERALGDFNPEDKPYLMKTFSNSKVSIYRVVI